ncbi:metallophosphoesterase [Bacillus solitudinis]|uniref:metallophosphoesterase n=1 Tax=Bacillus solitudinis TaxID=2014074 RepID=UPI000C23F575|nr:metallophosphoesterase [Bacillus solitudinis]
MSLLFLKNKKSRRYIYFIVGFILLIYFIHFQNNSIETTEYTFNSTKIPNSFEGYKIVQLSDLHSKSFGNNQSQLVKRVEKVNPDLIVFTGDLVDSKRYEEKNSLLLMERLVEIAPVYFVTGNHEWWSGKFDRLEVKLNNIGVHVMRNSVEEIDKGGEKFQIIGIDDPAKAKNAYSDQEIAEGTIKDIFQEVEKHETFNILLAHRPELFFLYSQFGFDLVFSGHAHGGQFRIPFIGGIVAPNQGLFPEFYSAKFILDHTTMIVSRGLGNSIIPIRLFNRPEIVVLTLQAPNNQS